MAAVKERANGTGEPKAVRPEVKGRRRKLK